MTPAIETATVSIYLAHVHCEVIAHLFWSLIYNGEPSSCLLLTLPMPAGQAYAASSGGSSPILDAVARGRFDVRVGMLCNKKCSGEIVVCAGLVEVDWCITRRYVCMSPGCPE